MSHGNVERGSDVHVHVHVHGRGDGHRMGDVHGRCGWDVDVHRSGDGNRVLQAEGRLMLTVLVEMFIWAAIVTEWLVLPRFIAVVFMAVAETGVVEAELQTSVLSVEHGERDRRSVRACVGDVCILFPNSLGI